MTAADDDWVKAAMADDTMVVELLVRLHRDSPPLPKPDVFPLEWTVRQRRSKSVSINNPKKPVHRGSPTTPLSWNGATSLSEGSGGCAGGGGSEESSLPPRPKLFDSTRSKVDGESQKTAFKRSRKKKNLAELKEEENSLTKERRELKRKIAALHIHLEKQRSTNENLKRMKAELQSFNKESTSLSEETMFYQLQETRTDCLPFTLSMLSNASSNNVALQSSSSNDSPDKNTHAASSSKFILPDLNIPFDEVQVIC